MTTAVRTVIDCAGSMTDADVLRMVRHGLDRGLFTATELRERASRNDIAARAGATRVRAVVDGLPADGGC